MNGMPFVRGSGNACLEAKRQRTCDAVEWYDNRSCLCQMSHSLSEDPCLLFLLLSSFILSFSFLFSLSHSRLPGKRDMRHSTCKATTIRNAYTLKDSCLPLCTVHGVSRARGSAFSACIEGCKRITQRCPRTWLSCILERHLLSFSEQETHNVREPSGVGVGM